MFLRSEDQWSMCKVAPCPCKRLPPRRARARGGSFATVPPLLCARDAASPFRSRRARRKYPCAPVWDPGPHEPSPRPVSPSAARFRPLPSRLAVLRVCISLPSSSDPGGNKSRCIMTRVPSVRLLGVLVTVSLRGLRQNNSHCRNERRPLETLSVGEGEGDPCSGTELGTGAGAAGGCASVCKTRGATVTRAATHPGGVSRDRDTQVS